MQDRIDELELVLGFYANKLNHQYTRVFDGIRTLSTYMDIDQGKKARKVLNIPEGR